MNPTEILMSQLQNRLKSQNPQLFQQFQNLIQNQNDPKEFLNKTFSNYSPEQMQQFKKFASGFGVTDEQFKQYGIGTKK